MIVALDISNDNIKHESIIDITSLCVVCLLLVIVLLCYSAHNQQCEVCFVSTARTEPDDGPACMFLPCFKQCVVFQCIALLILCVIVVRLVLLLLALAFATRLDLPSLL